LLIACFRGCFADRTGLEPATSAVTGRHSNQLNYRSSIEGAKIVIFFNNQTLFIIRPFELIAINSSRDCQEIVPKTQYPHIEHPASSIQHRVPQKAGSPLRCDIQSRKNRDLRFAATSGIEPCLLKCVNYAKYSRNTVTVSLFRVYTFVCKCAYILVLHNL